MKHDLTAMREAVAETIPYCGQGETVPNAWARRGRAERILLDAVPALLDEVEGLRAEHEYQLCEAQRWAGRAEQAEADLAALKTRMTEAAITDDCHHCDEPRPDGAPCWWCGRTAAKEQS